MEPEGLLECSQETATGSTLKPDESSPHPPTQFPDINLNIILDVLFNFLPPGCESEVWIELGQDRFKCRALIKSLGVI
jgi:hypothetical protein